MESAPMDPPAAEDAPRERRRRRKKKKHRHRRSRSREPSHGRTTRRGRSSSSSRSRSKSRSRSRSRSASPRKSRKRFGMRLDPSDWTGDELQEKLRKFAKYTIDKATGSSTLEVEGRRLFGEDLEIVLEMCRRYTEIQHVYLTKCFLTDDSFLHLYEEGICHLRHVLTLSITMNAVTGKSVKLLIREFSKAVRKLKHLDIRENNLLEEDGVALYKSFPMLETLNGVPVMAIKRNADTDTIDLSNCKLKAAEMPVVCGLVQDCRSITNLVLARNYIDSTALKLITKYFPKMTKLLSLDLQFNTITDQGKNFTGMLDFVRFVAKSPFLCHVNVNGNGVPPDLMDRLERSLQVNRSLRGSADGNFFNKFISSVLQARAPPPPVNPFKELRPNLQLDAEFISSCPELFVREAEVVEHHICFHRYGKR